MSSLSKITLATLKSVPEFEYPLNYPLHQGLGDHSFDWGNNADANYNRLYATFSQADFSVVFDQFELLDRQCVSMSLVALVYTVLISRIRGPPRLWSIVDLYQILRNGNEYYAQTLNYVCTVLLELQRLRNEHYYLAASQIKVNDSILFGQQVQLRLGQFYFGYVLRGHRRFGGLVGDLRAFFARYHLGVIIADKRARAIFYIDNKYYIFDPHAVRPHMTAVLIESESIEKLYDEMIELMRGKIEEEEVLVNVKYDLIPVELVNFSTFEKHDQIDVENVPPVLPFQCIYETCNKTFSYAKQLQDHQRQIHKRYQCTVKDCNKFVHWSNRCEHERRHAGIKAWHCNWKMEENGEFHLASGKTNKNTFSRVKPCKYRSARSGDVLRHIRLCHFKVHRRLTAQDNRAEQAIVLCDDPKQFLFVDTKMLKRWKKKRAKKLKKAVL